jgi:hypothetical protein
MKHMAIRPVEHSTIALEVRSATVDKLVYTMTISYYWSIILLFKMNVIVDRHTSARVIRRVRTPEIPFNLLIQDTTNP